MGSNSSRIRERVLSLIGLADDPIERVNDPREDILDYYVNTFDSPNPLLFTLNSKSDCADLRSFMHNMNQLSIEKIWFAKRNLATSILIPKVAAFLYIVLNRNIFSKLQIHILQLSTIKSSLISHWAMIFKVPHQTTSCDLYLLVEYISEGVQFYLFMAPNSTKMSENDYLNLVFAWMFGFTGQVRFKAIETRRAHQVDELLDAIEKLIVEENFVDVNYDVINKNCQKFILHLMRSFEATQKLNFTESARIYAKLKAPQTLIKIYIEDFSFKRVELKTIEWNLSESF